MKNVWKKNSPTRRSFSLSSGLPAGWQEVDLSDDDQGHISASMEWGQHRKQFSKKQTNDDEIDLGDRSVKHRKLVSHFFIVYATDILLIEYKLPMIIVLFDIQSFDYAQIHQLFLYSLIIYREEYQVYSSLEDHPSKLPNHSL